MPVDLPSRNLSASIDLISHIDAFIPAFDLLAEDSLRPSIALQFHNFHNVAS